MPKGFIFLDVGGPHAAREFETPAIHQLDFFIRIISTTTMKINEI